jgi:hypothetical protein
MKKKMMKMMITAMKEEEDKNSRTDLLVVISDAGGPRRAEGLLAVGVDGRHAVGVGVLIAAHQLYDHRHVTLVGRRGLVLIHVDELGIHVCGSGE